MTSHNRADDLVLDGMPVREGAGLIGAVVGAIIVLLVYGMVAGRRRAI